MLTRTERFLLLVLVVLAAVYVVPCGLRPMTATDEYRYAEIPREMLARGDWISPRLNGVRYFEKPVGGYWLNAIAMQVFGENAFAVRLPTVLATLLAGISVYALARSGTGRRAPALLASVVYLSSFLVFVLGTSALLDAMFTAAVTMSLTAFWFAFRATRPGPRFWWLALFGAAVGAGFLIKGFLAVALPGLVIAPFLVMERRYRALLTWPWVPLVSAAAVALPWCISIAHHEPDFWRYFVVEEHLGRFTGQGTASHGAPVYFYLIPLVGGLIPWLFFLPGAVRGLEQIGWRGSPLLRFSVLWFALPFLFFSASSGKLMSYILPCMAPAVLLLTLGLVQRIEAGDQRTWRAGTAVLLVLLGAGLIFGLVVQLGNVFGFPIYPASLWPMALYALIGMLWWITTVWRARRATGSLRGPGWLGLSMTAAYLGFAVAVPQDFPTLEARYPRPLLEAHRSCVTPDTVLVSDSKLVHAVCWTYHRTDVFILNRMGELYYGLMQPDGQGRYIDTDTFRALLVREWAHQRVVMVLRKGTHRRFFHRYPTPTQSFEQNGVWFAVYEPGALRGGG